MGGRNGKVSGVRGVWCGVCNLEMDANFPRAGAPLRCWARSLLRARLEETGGRNGTGYCGDRQQQGSSRGRGSGGPAWWGTDDRGSVSSHHLPRGVPSRWRAVRRTLARANAAHQLAKLFKAACAGRPGLRAGRNAARRAGTAVPSGEMPSLRCREHGGGATIHPYACVAYLKGGVAKNLLTIFHRVHFLFPCGKPSIYSFHYIFRSP